MKIGWGKGIAAVYIVFALVTIIGTVYFMRKDVDLVSANYYEKEIKYQEQINKINNTNKLKENVKIEYSEGKVVITFPKIGEINGDLNFYRPSDSKKDFKMPIKIDSEGRQIVDAASLQKGYWKLKVEWKSGGTDYYNELQLII